MRPLFIVALLSSLAPPAVHAQGAVDPSALYEEGRALAQARDYAAAVARFEQAYALHPEARHLQAQAMALQAQHLLGRAARLHRRLLRDHPDAPQEAIERSRRQIEALRPELDTVRVVVVDAGEGDRVLLDGEAVRVHTDGTLLVDPGAHVLSLERGSERVARVELDARAGGGSEVRLEAAAPAVEPPQVARPPEPQDPLPGAAIEAPAPRAPAPEVWESPWLWVGVGIVVLIAVGIGVGVAVGGEAPYEGTLMPGHLSF